MIINLHKSNQVNFKYLLLGSNRLLGSGLKKILPSSQTILTAKNKSQYNFKKAKKVNTGLPKKLIDISNKYFIIGNNYDPYRFMTITDNCSGVIVKSSLAAVHIDKTARPQIVDIKDNKRIYKIIQEYKKINGTPILINTGFNIHEEPIVYSPKDALRAFIN